MKQAALQTPATDMIQSGAGRLTLNERLALIGLIDEGMKGGLDQAPIVADLFDNLWELVNRTVAGATIERVQAEDARNGFKVLEITGESGETLGYLNMLYLKKPLPCYYLVYVEVAPPFRKQGLGHRILDHLRDFLSQKSALGLLDNIIPKEDPTNDLYNKHAWEPIENIIGDAAAEGLEEYMVYVPSRWAGRPIRRPLIKLVHHLRRRRAVIDMRDNEAMVRQTIAEFRDLYSALLTYFAEDLAQGRPTPLLRFMFTRFVTKLVAFRRRIGDLLGYTGGESMEQIKLAPAIAALPLQSYAPRELAGRPEPALGDRDLLARLPRELVEDPPRAIEALPNYHRPSLTWWLEERGRLAGDPLTVGDLMDLGFDPTRLKELNLDGTDYIFERIQARQLPDLEAKQALLRKASQSLAGAVAARARILVNPPLLALRNRGNAYVLRRKIPGIHWEEAVGQLKTNPALKPINAHLNLDRLIQATARQAFAAAAQDLGADEDHLRRHLACFVSWDLASNQPGLVVDFSGHYLESVWLA
ncbi:MAG: GNAT family N-acetyltransferase [Thermodesulfobacteriota bacterium]